MMPKDDWRRRRQEDYLTGVRLYHVPFTPLSEQWDHGHCEFCFEKFFLHPDHPECIREGYCTAPRNGPGAYWICPDCFRASAAKSAIPAAMSWSEARNTMARRMPLRHAV